VTADGGEARVYHPRGRPAPTTAQLNRSGWIASSPRRDREAAASGILSVVPGRFRAMLLV